MTNQDGMPVMDFDDVRLVVFDVDGTLRAHDDPGCSRAARALDALDGAGVPWTISTGRPWGSLLTATADLFALGLRSRRATSCLNGAAVHVPGGRPRTMVRHLTPSAVAEVLALAHDLRMGAVVFSCAVREGLPIETIRTAGLDATYHIDQYWPGTHEVHDARLGHDQAVASVVLLNPGIPSMGQVEAMQARLGDAVTVSTSGWTSYEVSDRGVCKGSSLVDLAAEFGCRPDQVMAVGDGVNDVTMLASAGVGVAVGNAPPSVRAAADIVTMGHAGDGVSEAVTALLHGRTARRRAGPTAREPIQGEATRGSVLESFA